MKKKNLPVIVNQMFCVGGSNLGDGGVHLLGLRCGEVDSDHLGDGLNIY